MIAVDAIVCSAYEYVGATTEEVKMALVGRGSDQFILRLPDGLRDRIKAAASKNYRSMNSELIAQIERLYPEGSETKKADAAA